MGQIEIKSRMCLHRLLCPAGIFVFLNDQGAV